MIKIIMGSKTDYEIMKQASNLLDSLNYTNYSIEIISAHRTPQKLYDFASNLDECDIVIAGAGGSAHLAGMVAAICINPVIGVPIKSSNLNGIDSLLSIVQMPKGVCVATVAINGSINAALLALQILALNDKQISKKLKTFRENQTTEVLEYKL